jgi:HEAT repeat protein
MSIAGLRTLVVILILSPASLAQTTIAQDAINSLLKQLDSKNAKQKVEALKRLAELGPQAAPATDRLVAVLLRFDDEERPLAVAALGKIGKPAIPALEKLLTHEDDLMRHDAAWALGLIEPDAKASVPLLLKQVLHDADDAARLKAIVTLSQIDANDKEALQAVVKLAGPYRSSRGARGE